MSTPLSPTSDLTELVDRARAVRERAYAPYSRFLVGAALRTASGRVFVGCNVENASYGATICAERGAVSTMVAEGEREIADIAVFTDGDSLAMPCGMCRQVLAEFASPTCRVLVASPRESKETTLGALLPEPCVFRR
jgi:cytidine deaminase